MNKLLVAEKLREAADLVDKGWARGAVALNAHGERVSANDPAAVCWCAVGAIQRACVDERRAAEASLYVTPQPIYYAALTAADEAVRDITGSSTAGIVAYNDGVAKFADEVSSLLRRAAARQVM